MAEPAPQASPFDDLNAAQRAAATHGEAGPDGVRAGPLLIIAGAGTGKPTGWPTLCSKAPIRSGCSS